MSKIKLFTHTDMDGIGCAVLAYLAFGQENVDVEFCDYKDVDEKVRDFYLHNDKAYDHIFITDISINEENAQEIDSWVARDKVTLLDHHGTAEWLNMYDWCMVRVELLEENRRYNEGVLQDIKRYYRKTSGTELFYNYLIDYEYISLEKNGIEILNNILRFVDIVRDYDTWRWKEETDLDYDGIICKQINDLFHMYGRDKFIEWCVNKINNNILFNKLNDNDLLLLENKQKDIDIYIAMKDKQLMTVKDNFGYTCGVVFAERYFSELGNKLSELHPELDYIAMVDIGYGGVSYRTVKDDIDLGGEIAHSFGGGGHRKAAGSSFDGEFMRGLVMNEVFGLSLGTSHIWHQDNSLNKHLL